MPPILPFRFPSPSRLFLFGLLLMLGLSLVPADVLAQGSGFQVNTSDSTFGGFTKLIAMAFWAMMFAMIAVAIIAGVAAAVMAYRQQEVPVMLLVAIVTCLAIPAIAFILGRMLGLGTALDMFNASGGTS